VYLTEVFYSGYTFLFDVVRLCLWTAATNGPVVFPQMIYEYGALVEWCWQGKTEEPREKPVSAPLRPPQIPRGLTRVWTRVSAVRNQRLSASAMARP
jgi:hypothetical protein